MVKIPSVYLSGLPFTQDVLGKLPELDVVLWTFRSNLGRIFNPHNIYRLFDLMKLPRFFHIKPFAVLVLNEPKGTILEKRFCCSNTV